MNERRQSPRYNIELPVDLVQGNDNILSAMTRNISSNGLQIVCDSWATNKIEPRGIQSHSLRHLRFKVVADLPTKGDSLKLYVNCRIMSVQRLSQDEYVLSLAFIDFENGTESAIDKFIDQYTQTNVIHKGVVGE